MNENLVAAIVILEAYIASHPGTVLPAALAHIHAAMAGEEEYEIEFSLDDESN